MTDHDYFMSEVYKIAERSDSLDTHVGAQVVDVDGIFISEGYNHLIPGIAKTEWNLRNGQLFIHAESMAVRELLMSRVHKLPLTMYTNGIPCFECAKDIQGTGIRTIVIDKKWNDDNSPRWKKSIEEALVIYNATEIRIVEWSGILRNNVKRFRRGKYLD